jgi:hypothetical protein
VGCGGDDDDDTTAATTTEDAAEAAALYDEIADLPDEEQIEQVGAAWAEPFSEFDEAMCDYLHPDIAPGGSTSSSCSELASGALIGTATGQKSYAGATVKSVEVEGETAVAKFSNGEEVEFQKDPSDEWKITGAPEP